MHNGPEMEWCSAKHFFVSYQPRLETPSSFRHYSFVILMEFHRATEGEPSPSGTGLTMRAAAAKPRRTAARSYIARELSAAPSNGGPDGRDHAEGGEHDDVAVSPADPSHPANPTMTRFALILMVATVMPMPTTVLLPTCRPRRCPTDCDSEGLSGGRRSRWRWRCGQQKYLRRKADCQRARCLTLKMAPIA